MKPEVQAIFDKVKSRDPNQPEFLQAVEEVIESLEPLFEKYPHYLKVKIWPSNIKNFKSFKNTINIFKVLPAVCEPERVVQFRVPWLDDNNQMWVWNF